MCAAWWVCLNVSTLPASKQVYALIIFHCSSMLCSTRIPLHLKLLLLFGVISAARCKHRQTPSSPGYGNIPEQVHLSIGSNFWLTKFRLKIYVDISFFLLDLGVDNEYVVTWTTFNATSLESVVRYGLTRSNLNYANSGNWTLFVDGGGAKRKSYIHRVFLSDLKSNTTYCKNIIWQWPYIQG